MQDFLKSVTRSRANTVVWAVWLAMTLGLLFLIFRFGVDAPYMDEWDETVPIMTGTQPLTLSWLWSLHNEHRIFLPRLVTTVLVHLFPGGLYSIWYLDALILSGLAFALIQTVARQRGGDLRYTDAFFPLVLLSWAQFGVVLWPFEIQFILSVLLSLVVFLLIVTYADKPPTLPVVLLMGLCLILLPLCGSNGLVFAPLLALWLFLWAGTSRPRASGSARGAAFALGIGAFAVIVLYYIGYHKASPLSLRPAAVLRTVTEFLYSGFGVGVFPSSAAGGFNKQTISNILPLLAVLLAAFLVIIKRAQTPREAAQLRQRAGVAGLVACLLILALIKIRPAVPLGLSQLALMGLVPVCIVVTLPAVLLALRRWDADRIRVLGVLAMLGCQLLLALGIAVGRADGGPGAGAQLRYMTLADGVLCTLYIAAELYCRPNARRITQYLLFSLALLSLPFNLNRTYPGFKIKRQTLAAMRQDIASGRRTTEIVMRYGGFLGYDMNGPQLAERLPQVRDIGYRTFQGMQDDPPTQPVTLENPVSNAAQGGGRDFTYHFPAPTNVYRIEVTLIRPHDPALLPSPLEVSWQPAEGTATPARSVKLDAAFNIALPSPDAAVSGKMPLPQQDASATVLLIDQPITELTIHLPAASDAVTLQSVVARQR